jgi:hypothetical protein
MKKLVLTKKEKIVAIVILFWTFITLSNYLTGNGVYTERDNRQYFMTPWSNIQQFFEYYIGPSSGGTHGFDNSELMVYGVLPWLVFFTYLFLKKKNNDS